MLVPHLFYLCLRGIYFGVLIWSIWGTRVVLFSPLLLFFVSLISCCGFFSFVGKLDCNFLSVCGCGWLGGWVSGLDIGIHWQLHTGEGVMSYSPATIFPI